MALQEKGVRSAAAERFNAHRAGAGVGIQENGAGDARRQDIEQRFAQAVGRGTRGRAGNAPQSPRTEFAGDDAHQPTVTRP